MQRFQYYLKDIQLSAQDTADILINQATAADPNFPVGLLADAQIAALFADAPPAERTFNPLRVFADTEVPAPRPNLPQFLDVDSPPRPGSKLQFILDSHANRISAYPAAAFPAGSTFLESDRKVRYTSDGTNWIDPIGVMIAALASRPADLGANDAGFVFLANDATQELFYWWSGAAWVTVAATTTITPAIYGDASNVPQLTIDQWGRITVAASVPINLGGISATVALAKLTTLGSDGSITFVNGIATAKVDPT